MTNEGEEKEARMGRLAPMWDELRSYLGIVALLAIVLPAVVLVLTLLADSIRPLPEQASDGGVERGEAAHRQDQPEGNRSGGGGEEEKVRPLSQRDEDVAPEGGSGADRSDSTRQTVRDQGGAGGGQDPPNNAAAPATSAATAAPASTAEPALVSASASPMATAPATASASAPVETRATNPEPASAPVAVGPMPTPDEFPLDVAQDAVSDPQLYRSSK